MADYDIKYLAILLFLYALYEFFLKRVRWGANDFVVRRRAQSAITLFIVLMVGTSGMLSFSLVVGYIAFVLVYALYDLLVMRRGEKIVVKRSLELFLVKQLIVGILMLVLWKSASPFTTHGWYENIEGWVLSGMEVPFEQFTQNLTAYLVLLTCYLFMVDGGTQIVKGVLAKFPGLYQRVIDYLNNQKNTVSVAPKDTATSSASSSNDTTASYDSEENVGEWIGILERIITLTFVMTGSFTAIAFALTAKSIARFKELEESKDFAEYYLLGTSTSILTALLAGTIVKGVLGL